MRPRFVVAMVVIHLGGCGGDPASEDPIACTAELRPGIIIEVLDNATGAPASCGAQAVITASGYSETVQNPDVPGCVNTLLLSGAAERPGTYNVTVSKPGFQNVLFGNVVVAADVCHVITVTLTARLAP